MNHRTVTLIVHPNGAVDATARAVSPSARASWQRQGCSVVSASVELPQVTWLTELPVRTIIESPLGSRPDGSRCSPEEFARNRRYALRCMRDSFDRGEAPFGSHVLYPLLLDDATPAEREQGMLAGFSWGAVAQRVAVYTDHGITPGMQRGLERHAAFGIETVYRAIGEEP